MTNPESAHPLAKWAHRPMLFAAATALLGCVGFAVALALPAGLLSFALAGCGAVAGVAGLLTMVLLAVARAYGLQPPATPEEPAPAPQPTMAQTVEQPTEPLVLDLTDDNERSHSR